LRDPQVRALRRDTLPSSVKMPDSFFMTSNIEGINVGTSTLHNGGSMSQIGTSHGVMNFRWPSALADHESTREGQSISDLHNARTRSLQLESIAIQIQIRM
jgi:hypothetical protein